MKHTFDEDDRNQFRKRGDHFGNISTYTTGENQTVKLVRETRTRDGVMHKERDRTHTQTNKRTHTRMRACAILHWTSEAADGMTDQLLD